MTEQHPAVKAASDALATRLDLEAWERHGWPTIADDLAAVAVPAVLRHAAQHQRDHAAHIHNMVPNDDWHAGATKAAAILDTLAARLDPEQV